MQLQKHGDTPFFFFFLKKNVLCATKLCVCKKTEVACTAECSCDPGMCSRRQEPRAPMKQTEKKKNEGNN